MGIRYSVCNRCRESFYFFPAPAKEGYTCNKCNTHSSYDTIMRITEALEDPRTGILDNKDRRYKNKLTKLLNLV